MYTGEGGNTFGRGDLKFNEADKGRQTAQGRVPRTLVHPCTVPIAPSLKKKKKRKTAAGWKSSTASSKTACTCIQDSCEVTQKFRGGEWISLFTALSGSVGEEKGAEPYGVWWGRAAGHQLSKTCFPCRHWLLSLFSPQRHLQVVCAFPCLLPSSFSLPLCYSRGCKREQHHPAPSNKPTCYASAFRILLLLAALCWRGTAHLIPTASKMSVHFRGADAAPLVSVLWCDTM